MQESMLNPLAWDCPGNPELFFTIHWKKTKQQQQQQQQQQQHQWRFAD
jgi:hypothetical protein